MDTPAIHLSNVLLWFQQPNQPYQTLATHHRVVPMQIALMESVNVYQNIVAILMKAVVQNVHPVPIVQEIRLA
jgi:hypothetical protein